MFQAVFKLRYIRYTHGFWFTHHLPELFPFLVVCPPVAHAGKNFFLNFFLEITHVSAAVGSWFYLNCTVSSTVLGKGSKSSGGPKPGV